MFTPRLPLVHEPHLTGPRLCWVQACHGRPRIGLRPDEAECTTRKKGSWSTSWQQSSSRYTLIYLSYRICMTSNILPLLTKRCNFQFTFFPSQQFVICTFPAAILSIIYMNKSSYDQVSFSIFRAFANNMVRIYTIYTYT
jgi:hypothetical protein